MATSQVEHLQEQDLDQGYIHKKFNRRYIHKKLRMRLRQKEDNNKENLDIGSQQTKVTKKEPLFRPYDLGDDTPRKRKISRSSVSSDGENVQSQFVATSVPTSSTSSVNQTPEVSFVPAADQSYSSTPLSSISYADYYSPPTSPETSDNQTPQQSSVPNVPQIYYSYDLNSDFYPDCYSPPTSPINFCNQILQQSVLPVMTQTCSNPPLSPNSYAERLQRQRAALYMRYMQQFCPENMATSQAAPAIYHPMGYPNVTAPLYNDC